MRYKGIQVIFNHIRSHQPQNNLHSLFRAMPPRHLFDTLTNWEQLVFMSHLGYAIEINPEVSSLQNYLVAIVANKQKKITSFERALFQGTYVQKELSEWLQKYAIIGHAELEALLSLPSMIVDPLWKSYHQAPFLMIWQGNNTVDLLAAQGASA